MYEVGDQTGGDGFGVPPAGDVIGGPADVCGRDPAGGGDVVDHHAVEVGEKLLGLLPVLGASLGAAEEFGGTFVVSGVENFHFDARLIQCVLDEEEFRPQAAKVNDAQGAEVDLLAGTGQVVGALAVVRGEGDGELVRNPEALDGLADGPHGREGNGQVAVVQVQPLDVVVLGGRLDDPDDIVQPEDLAIQVPEVRKGRVGGNVTA